MDLQTTCFLPSAVDPRPAPDLFPWLGSGDLEEMYERLRLVARKLMARESSPNQTLDPTGLVHEVVIRLAASKNLREQNDPRYLMTAALRTMQRILIDRARARDSLKRGRGHTRNSLDLVFDQLASQKVRYEELHEALARLASWDQRQADIVSMRFLLGMTISEIAQCLELSESTIATDLKMARAWLYRELS
jgi:RNA polymerase sigma factor (TIGR02999 family)